ncbi:uncharacterized protein LOC127857125 [Dreissena polymorpha]|uniref:uncharacterized protein LOC127857125 n=1 Tax=Dreissena polymorpha TaxID=45954 RepID=UPI002264AE0C|nr:uncharacterized protein LOC127857125 [Dreissena polymorpha]
MHVTVTCFKQVSVTRPQTDKPPIFIGPMFLHDNSDFETYSHFLSHLKTKLDSTNTKLDRLVIGSDDERSIVKASKTVFHDSTHVLCTRHLRQNTKHRLTDDAINKQLRNEILDTIYGDDGIIHAYDDICFDHRCDRLEQQLTGVSSKFLDYFKSKLKPQLREFVNRPNRLDLVDDNWTNNNCESINHVLKQSIDWKTKPLTELVDTLRSIVNRQYRDLKSALLGTGEYRLSEMFQSLKVSKSVWISMTDGQRDKHYKRFRTTLLDLKGLITSTDTQTTIVAPKTHGKKPNQLKRKVNAKTTTIKRKKND